MKNAKPFALLLTFALSAVAFAGSPDKPAPKTQPDDLVALALLAESRGDSAERTRFLNEALAAAPDLPAVNWQSGRVWQNDAWVTPEQAAAALSEDRRLVEYRNVRGDHPDTVEGQMELAAWCARRGLHDQKRAHLTRVLEFNPGHVGARRELGHRWVDGVWLTPDEQQAAARRAIQAEYSLANWSPKLEKLRDAMDRRNQRQREIALERLKEIKDPSAIPALEAVFSMHNEPAAVALVDVLAEIEGVDAATALARQAVFSPSEYVRGEAAKKLHARPYEQFVPTLLDAMYTPVQTKWRVYYLPNGSLMQRHLLYREGMETGQAITNDVAIAPRPTNRGMPESVSLSYLLASAHARLFFERRAQLIRQRAELQNANTAALNCAIGETLTAATHETLPPDPDAWWHWWADRNEVETLDQKPVDKIYTSERLRVDETGWMQVQPKASCLVAGTPVWTETGYVPIEQISIGDRVLAKDPNSGELTYKPVLRTTRRDPVDTLRIDAGPAGALTCSGGHLFWVSGKGWVRARVMDPGMMLHTLDGPHEVVSVTITPPAEVFNLVVADHHSYFVTEGRWLTHDNTPQAPTSAIVPGLAKSK
jgi:hypothetical protein